MIKIIFSIKKFPFYLKLIDITVNSLISAQYQLKATLKQNKRYTKYNKFDISYEKAKVHNLYDIKMTSLKIRINLKVLNIQVTYSIQNQISNQSNLSFNK